MVLRVEMLGTARVIVDGHEEIQLRSTLRDQALAYLAYTGDWIPRERLGFLFWADTPDETARHNVRQLLKRIRRLDWLTGFEVEGDNVRWIVPTDLEGLRNSSGRTWGNLPRTGRLLPGLERGASFEFEEWLLLERRLILGEWQTALLRAVEAADREGKPGEALMLLEPALDQADGEKMLLRYMDLAARTGDRDKGIRAFRSVTERMRADLGLEPSEQARALFERLCSGDDGYESDGSSPIVGRTQETNEILGLLANPACRLLTLLGPGGIGKSTLAGVVADSAAHMFGNGSIVVSLESISDPESIPSVIATGLEVHLDGRIDVLDQLGSALREQHLLLVVDNVEHLRDGWVLLSELERACPRLKILVTSRERLRLEDEWVYEVGGLAAAEAAELLLQRARQVAPAVKVSEDQAVLICEAVGGSPLGIELAVPWLRVMSPEEIINEVLGDTALLSGGNRDTPNRHRSLETAMAHSWRLLTKAEKQATEALAVFVAPYTRELAEDVAQLDASLLRDLTDKSLIGYRAAGRYASHPLVRQYAASRLASDSHRRSEVRSRHARAVLGLLDPPGQALAHRSHLDDMIEAWLHAVELADHELVGRSVDGFGLLLDSTGRINQGLELLARARTKLDDGAAETRSVAAALRVIESRLLQIGGRHQESRELAQSAVDVATNANAQYWLVRALIVLAWARKWIEGDAAQHSTLLQALPLAQSSDDERLMADVLHGLGCSAPTLEECREYLGDALQRTSGLHEPFLHWRVLSALGSVLWGLGEIPEAMSLHQEMLDLARNDGILRAVVGALIDLAFLHGEIGDLDKARKLSDEAESMSAGEEFVDQKISVTQIAGEILRLLGDRDAAQARVYESLRLVTAIGLPPFGLRSLRLHGQLLIDQGQAEEGLGMLALVCSWTRRGPDFTGWILDPRIWEENTQIADPEQIQRARVWAKNQELDKVVEKVLAETSR